MFATTTGNYMINKHLQLEEIQRIESGFSVYLMWNLSLEKAFHWAVSLFEPEVSWCPAQPTPVEMK